MVQRLLAAVAIALCCLSRVDFAQGMPANLTEDNHNIDQCPDPSLIVGPALCQLNVQESAKFLDTITKTIYCPESGVNTKKIICITVKDNVDNDDGGYASIISGGLNQYSVEIYLKSQFSKRIDFHIEVYTE